MVDVKQYIKMEEKLAVEFHIFEGHFFKLPGKFYETFFFVTFLNGIVTTLELL